MQETINNLASSEALTSLATIEYVNSQDNALRVRLSRPFSLAARWMAWVAVQL
jgi:hypothetical protein